LTLLDADETATAGTMRSNATMVDVRYADRSTT
jgi:hypothetical protein